MHVSRRWIEVLLVAGLSVAGHAQAQSAADARQASLAPPRRSAAPSASRHSKRFACAATGTTRIKTAAA